MGMTLLKSLVIYSMIFSCWSYNFWKNDNQQAYDLFHQKNYDEAEHLFHDVDWKGIAAYRKNDYALAVKHLSQTQTAEGYYNLGNAYAQLGHLEEAIKAYQKTLLLDPQNVDASFNLQLLEQDLQRQEEERKRKEEEEKKRQEEEKKRQEEERQRQEEEEKQKQADKEQQPQDQPQNEEQNQEQTKSNENDESAQQKEWLSFLNEDPSGLLRQKFLNDYRKARLEGTV